jgi:hypothetical protein
MVSKFINYEIRFLKASSSSSHLHDSISSSDTNSSLAGNSVIGTEDSGGTFGMVAKLSNE